MASAPHALDENDTPLRAERKRLGLSVRAVAEAVGYDPSNLSRLELGQHTPPRDVARALHAFYGGAVPMAGIYDPTFVDVDRTRELAARVQSWLKRYAGRRISERRAAELLKAVNSTAAPATDGARP